MNRAAQQAVAADKPLGGAGLTGAPPRAPWQDGRTGSRRRLRGPPAGRWRIKMPVGASGLQPADGTELSSARIVHTAIGQSIV
jgi:hypothetical protein